MGRFLAWADRRNFVSVRAFVLYSTVALTWYATVKGFEFATLSRYDGTGTALVIGAFTGPASALVAVVFASLYKGTEK